MANTTPANIDLTVVRWRKGSRSSGQGSNCVEIADLDSKITGGAPMIAIRDSKNPATGVFVLSQTDWADLAHTVKAGQLDL
jgi:hypothetical protein